MLLHLCMQHFLEDNPDQDTTLSLSEIYEILAFGCMAMKI